jgi:hypothetical protein
VTRFVVAVLAAFAVSAAAGAAVAGDLPVPPVPPAPGTAGPGFAPAPVPDPDITKPREDAEARPHAEVVPTFRSNADHTKGNGYVKGSEAYYDPDHRFRPAPGVNLLVPLQ